MKALTITSAILFALAIIGVFWLYYRVVDTHTPQKDSVSLMGLKLFVNDTSIQTKNR